MAVDFTQFTYKLLQEYAPDVCKILGESELDGDSVLETIRDEIRERTSLGEVFEQKLLERLMTEAIDFEAIALTLKQDARKTSN